MLAGERERKRKRGRERWRDPSLMSGCLLGCASPHPFLFVISPKLFFASPFVIPFSIFTSHQAKQLVPIAVPRYRQAKQRPANGQSCTGEVKNRTLCSLAYWSYLSREEFCTQTHTHTHARTYKRTKRFPNLWPANFVPISYREGAVCREKERKSKPGAGKTDGPKTRKHSGCFA